MTLIVSKTAIEFFESVDLRGWDVEFRNESIGYRGPIKFTNVLKNGQQKGYERTVLSLEIDWLAVKYGGPIEYPKRVHGKDGPWVISDTPKDFLCQEIYLDYLKYSISADVISFEHGRYKWEIRPSNIDRSKLLSEFHIAVRVPHSLYPPSPSEDMLFVGTVHNITPREPQSQDEVTEVEICFALFAKDYESACAWVRGECARMGLPIGSLKKTQLLPGY